ncbi:RsmB/NOP family class I SAM-dependent RNA methyltransferase [Paracoccus aurantiacus]|uniref:RsmB/NOP family class I SAM-dependent RNA methyltransferase n=1 Tax=Paracoccus aurantiacus TaxID=2599412 RepID=A0A5C6S4T1_9RHOB|nr:RsmB/NOP family class I SAM-dependent RNA methyltransferase [Paracoccus aurantiacus]TXB68603.1 RsmB/NOP family class I SAM-dependent RNA methyltransferase [Paracoccus aurantiacus]
MTPAARVAAAIEILDRVLGGTAAEAALIGWARASRFAGSGDRAAVRDLVFEALRRRDSLALLGGGRDGRALMLGLLRTDEANPDEFFTGTGHAPAALTEKERASGGSAQAADLLPDLPNWLWPDWQASIGQRALPLAHAMRARAPVWLRVNPRRASVSAARKALAQAGIETVEADALPTALRVTAGERKIANSEPYREGWVELQDLSPQLACASLPLAQGARVLDYCAGGGGKALALLSREDIEVTAHDAAPKRMADLPERARRAGVEVTLSPPAKLGGDYDLVVADVPCSGSGTWRRTPDAKWRLTRAGLDQLLAVQSQILDDASGLVRDGGLLAYMTCSLLDAENGEQISAFTGRQPQFVEIERQSWSPEDGSDGFFLALLRRGAGGR